MASARAIASVLALLGLLAACGGAGDTPEADAGAPVEAGGPGPVAEGGTVTPLGCATRTP